MTANDLTTGVTLRIVAAALAAAAVGGWLAGTAAALGVLVGGALAVGNFWLLAGRVTATSSGRASVAPWLMLAGLRFAAVGAVAAVVLVTGWAHPVALLVGYTALPVAVVVQGLRMAREER